MLKAVDTCKKRVRGFRDRAKCECRKVPRWKLLLHAWVRPEQVQYGGVFYLLFSCWPINHNCLSCRHPTSSYFGSFIC